MRSGVRRTILLCVALLLVTSATVVLFVVARRNAASYPPDTLPPVSFWYWHTPFAVSPEEAGTLQTLGVRELFVRAATFTYSGTPTAPVRAVLRQTWTPAQATKTTAGVARAVRLHLVFPVDATLVRRFETFPEETFARSLAQAVQAERQRALAQMGAGIVVGVQLDLDCPTRLLTRYATVLKLLRSRLSVGDTLSITLLTSWYDSRHIGKLLDQVDFSVPQFYEAQTSATRDQFHPISDLARLSRGLRQAERLGKPFFVGLPIYGHALVYDGKGRLRGLFHDAAAAEIIQRPQEFRFLGAAPLDRKGQDARTAEAFIGEERVEFGAARSRTDFRLLYDLPTPEMLRRPIAFLRSERLPLTCRGIILYRFAGRGEEAALPLATVDAVLKGRMPWPNLQLHFRTRRTAPFDLVESSAPAPPRTDLFVTVVNDGAGAARVAPDAVEVDLHFQGVVIESARSGSFERVEGFAGTPDKRASIARADGLRFSTAHLAPGERRVIGPITLLPVGLAATVGAQWHVVLPGGFNTVRGKLAPVALVPPKEKGPQ